MPSWGSGRADTTLSLRAEGLRGLGAKTPGSPVRACPGRLEKKPCGKERKERAGLAQLALCTELANARAGAAYPRALPDPVSHPPSASQPSKDSLSPPIPGVMPWGSFLPGGAHLWTFPHLFFPLSSSALSRRSP